MDASLWYFSTGNIFGSVDKRAGADSYIYATEDPCWILDVNPTNSKGLVWNVGMFN